MRQGQQGTPGARHGPLQHGGDVQEPTVKEDPNDAEDSTTEAKAINANKALRIAIDTMILVKKIQVESCFPQILSGHGGKPNTDGHAE